MTLHKVNKAQARKLYNAGRSVTMRPHKTHHTIFLELHGARQQGDFDALVNDFESCYCDTFKTGYYAAFYVEV